MCSSSSVNLDPMGNLLDDLPSISLNSLTLGDNDFTSYNISTHPYCTEITFIFIFYSLKLLFI